MSKPDIINGVFEFCGGIALAYNVKTIWRDKKIRGVSIAPVIFYSSWGIWNLYYYPILGQWFSFIGGLLPALMNITWVVLAIKFRKN